jgi:NodT family efflux transporter outer membrane factor (OMF) lipoprotein
MLRTAHAAADAGPSMTSKRPSGKAALLAAALPCLLAAGCTVGPDYAAPADKAATGWFASRPVPKPVRSEPVQEPVDPNWWKLLGDPQLTALEDRVAAENLDVRIATIKLAESRAQRGVVAAAQFPTLGGNASYQYEKASDNGVFALLGPDAAGGSSTPGTQAGGTGFGAGGINGSSLPPFSLYQYGLDATWELDLWGKVRRQVESADASIQASQESQRDALLSSLAEVARDYVDLRGAQLREKIAEENLKSSQDALKLTQERASGGLTTDLDVANAAAQVRTTAAEIPPIQTDQANLINALSLLLGEPPNALRSELEQPRPVPPVPPRVPVGVPSELARRRPDIREAEAQLHEATANIGVAVANFYPSVTLGGSVGIQGLQGQNLWTLNSRQFALGPSISIPIFEGGQLKANLQLNEASQQEAAVNYERTVLRAWHDVDNALTAYQDTQRRRDELVAAVAQNQRALALATDRYQQGVSDFLEVLDAQTRLLSNQQQLAIATTNVSDNLVALYKALGGGWETAYPDKTQVTDAGAAAGGGAAVR